ncbi:hypothetical protein P3W45_000173 [Vairimorpha bombi]|jgi:kinesin family member 22
MQKHKIPIKAFIRIRPSKKCLEYTNTTIKVSKENNQESEYVFDKVFGPSTSQLTIYKNIQESLIKFKEGFNTTLFCYGNTGAGKTHTMIGNKSSPGLIYNIVQDLLKNDVIDISYMEIYNEKIFDLLDPKEVILREFEGKILIQHIKKIRVEKYEDFKEIFDKGNSNRKTGETKLNKLSSRSHSILQISMGDAKFYLIDLAGSENNRKTGNEGIRLVESSNINRSLFVLGQVVNSILNNDTRIPYRDSKLTRLLQDSIGGNSICYLIANVIDDWDYLDDTINTLKFASKSRKIVNIGNAIRDIQSKSSTPKIGKNKVFSDKTNTPKKRKKKEDSTFIIKSSIYDKSDLLLTPNTQEKSYKAFLKRAEEFEKNKDYKNALDDYKTLKKIRNNSDIQDKIDELNGLIKVERNKKVKISRRELLDILNSGNFISIKKLSGVGDKRAQSIVDFIVGGNFFESLDDLKLLFSDKIIKYILTSIE